MSGIPAGQPRWRRLWTRYKGKHRQAHIPQWDSEEVLEWTDGGDAQYNPHEFATDEQVRELELRCLDSGSLVRDAGHKRTYYMRCPGVTVGACSGEYTEYVFVEWLDSGTVHGRPMCESELKRKGVRI
jgi:hypothetical protein